MPTWSQLCFAGPLRNSCYLLARFSVYVNTLFGLKKIDNLYEVKYLYPKLNFFQISTTKLFIYFFTIFLDCCKIW
jgi:hypothetical protein